MAIRPTVISAPAWIKYRNFLVCNRCACVVYHWVHAFTVFAFASLGRTVMSAWRFACSIVLNSRICCYCVPPSAATDIRQKTTVTYSSHSQNVPQCLRSGPTSHTR